MKARASVTTRDRRTGLLTHEHFERALAGSVSDALRDGRSYSVVACVPRSLPGEDVEDVVQRAAGSVEELMRKEDIAGRLEGNILVIGLAGGCSDAARVLAHRLQSELGVRSLHARTAVWDAGYACLPEHGETWRDLLSAAVDSARARRRRLAEPHAGPPIPLGIPTHA